MTPENDGENLLGSYGENLLSVFVWLLEMMWSIMMEMKVLGGK